MNGRSRVRPTGPATERRSGALTCLFDAASGPSALDTNRCANVETMLAKNDIDCMKTSPSYACGLLVTKWNGSTYVEAVVRGRISLNIDSEDSPPTY
ncbi:hypothetical protein HaLaN_23310 [Haematococcus lacustris]|uniref:Uncharacterized protein n=1 Tax=Haematococcus lacustris TaxID=44745 RepID=A0A6A0A1D8_HAELA|nr:hypothetical protein HaLaN_23310 [Haematococcus lacustris]